MAPSRSTAASPAAGAQADSAATTGNHRGKHGEGFFQTRFAQRVLPFMTSISVHAGIVIVAVLTYTAIQAIRHPEPRPYAPVASDIVSETQANLPGLANASLIPASQEDVESTTHGINTTFDKEKVLKSGIAGGGGEGEAPVVEVGLTGFGRNGLIGGMGKGGRPGGGEGGPAAMMGPRTLGAAGPRFGGLPLSAHKIAFVCDSSGSMLNKMPSLKTELIKAVAGLKVTQSFSIIFFQDTRPVMLSPSLIVATPQNKRRVADFLDGVTASGTTEPIAGIEAAFKQHPELIFLLTDGDFPDNQAVLARIRELNKGVNIRVNTIAFVGSGDTDTEFITVLKTIAKESGGDYRKVNEEELQ